MKAHIRLACPQEAEILSEIAFRSKSYWGYEQEYMQLAKAKLRITPDNIIDDLVFVLEMSCDILGFYELKRCNEKECELVWLFIDPIHIRKGHGKVLLNHAIEKARAENFEFIKIKSDPNAENFYKLFGAINVGKAHSTVNQSMELPILKIILREN